MKNSNILFVLKYLTAILLGGAVLAPAFAFAQVDANANAGLGATVTPTSVQTSVSGSATAQTSSAPTHASVTGATSAQATVFARAKTKADQEIARRITALTDLSARVAQMNKVTDALKTNLAANVKLQIDSFTALQAKIDADTDAATLKADIKSITDSYRVFMLVIPQSRIAAASDRMATIINMFIQDGTKIQARIQTAQSAGHDVTALMQTLTDMGTQLASAQTHAQAALNTTATLTPDNGDKAKMASTTAALKNARVELHDGQQDLVAARHDLDTLLKGLRAISASSTSSTTVKI